MHLVIPIDGQPANLLAGWLGFSLSARILGSSRHAAKEAQMTWTKALPIEKLSANKPVLFREGPKQIAVTMVGEQVLAFDNRCPHEGYPLREGQIDGNCVLTCHWHNWKFNLKDGRNLYGDDNLRTYPTRVEEGFVWLDLSDPDKDVVRDNLLVELKDAFDDRQTGRMARILAKFHFEGLNPSSTIAHALRWSYARFEYGTTHAIGSLPAWLELADDAEAAPDVRLAFLTEALDHMAFDSLRHPDYGFTEARRPYSDGALAQALAEEDESQAIALLNHALDHHKTYADLLPTLLRSVLDHYRDFGHALIYLHGAEKLIQRFGSEVTPFVLKPFVRFLCYSTREDMIPEFSGYRGRAEQIKDRAFSDVKHENLKMPTGLSTNQALDWVVEALDRYDPKSVYDAMMEQVGFYLVAWDTDHAKKVHIPIPKNVDWLDFTHPLTFATALFRFASDYPRVWPAGLLQIACFLGRAKEFVNPESDARPFLIHDMDQFHQETLELIADHGKGLPIFSAHFSKTYTAMHEIRGHLSERSARMVEAGVNRFLNGSMKQKQLRRTVFQAMELVGRGYK